MKEEKKKGIKDIIKSKLKKISNIALIVDGSSIEKEDLITQLKNIKKAIEDVGKLRTSKIVVKTLPSEEEVKKIQKLGFEIIIRASETDVYFVLEAMELLYNPKIEAVAISTRNEEFLQILNKGREKGKKTISINPSGSTIDTEMLKNLSDITIDLNVTG
ncbi:MAG: NYN domain-containing protein [Candidatus Odinarchaeota archaeon]